MAVTIKHAKTDTIADWTQSDLDAQIAAGNYPAGTVLADIVLPSDWNNNHTITGLGTIATQDASSVAITGGTVNNTSQSKTTITDYESFTPTTAPTYAEGELWYDSTAHALAYFNDVSSSTVHIGQDLQVKVINNTGSTIANGSPVYITSTSSGQTYPNIALAKADVAATSAVIGLTNGSIANGAVGYVTAQGGIDGVNTGSFTVGQVLYLSPYSAGQLMNTIPPTGITVQVGIVSYVNSSTGKIYVKQTTPLAVPASIITGTLGVDHGGTGQASALVAGGVMYGSSTTAMGVTAVGTSGQVLTSNGASAPTWTTPTTGTVTSVTGTSPIASSGGNTPAISISQATTSTNGYLSSTDWNTFNNKQPAGTYVTSVSATSPVTSSGGTTPAISMAAATTSVNGYLTSTDWTTFNGKQAALVSGTNIKTVNSTSLLGSGDVSVGVTSVTGTSPVVSSGGATPAISMAAASSTVNGYLTSTDWTTFNNKGSGTVTSVTGTAPVVSSGGATPAISMAAANTTTNGYLTSTDWNTFNNKVSMTYPGAGIPNSTGSAWGTSYTTTGSGTVIALSTSPTFATSILGDFNNATVANRTLFKTSTTNATTGIYAVPNGTATAASWQATNAADPTNASKILIATNGSTDVQLVSGINGTGTYLPLTFYNNGAEKARLSVAGGLSIGTTTDPGAGGLQVAGTANFTGSSSVLAAVFANAAETTTVSATAATGTINYDVTTQSVLYYTTNASANFTLNFRASSGTSLNTAMATGQTVTVVFLCTNGATAYYNNAVTIDGNSVTPKYQGGSAWTSGNASSIDAYSFTIIKTGSAAFTVLTSLTQFKQNNMAFGAFQISGFQRNAFQILTGSSPTPVVLIPKGGYKKHNKSFKQTVKESLQELLDEPKAVEEVKEIVSEYSNSNKLSLSSVDLKLLSQNVEAAQRIIMLAEKLQLERLELQREMDDEEALLLLI